MARSTLYCVALLLCLACLAHADHHLGNYDKKNNNKNAPSQQQQEDEMLDDDDMDMYNPRDALIKHLLKRASPRVPPPPQYLPIAVQVKLRPLAVRNVCPKTYSVEMPTLEMYNWTDPRLTWNASDFGGVQYIDISPRDIWMPDIAVWQSPGSTPMQTRPKEYNAVVTSDGNVLYIPVSELSISCDAQPWKRHNKAHNMKNSRTNSSSSSGRGRRAGGMHGADVQHTPDQQASEARQLQEPKDSDDWTGSRTYLCEFDQGPWIYDLSVVDVIPVSTGTPFHEHNETSSTGSEENEDQQNDESSTDVVQKSDRGTRRADHQFPAEDFDATADLSWFDGNEYYDVVSFTSEHFVERYTSFPVDWASIHYRLLVKVNTKEIGRVRSGRHNDDDDDDEEEEKAKKRKKQQQQAAKQRTSTVVQKKNAKTPLHRTNSAPAEDTTDTENDD